MGRISRRDDLVQFFMEGQGSLLKGDRVRDLSHEDRKIQAEINRAMRDLQRDVQAIYRLYAPRGLTGELRRRIMARAFFRASEVLVTVNSAARHGGFSYTPVTRFGHTAARIYPKRARMLVFPTKGGRIIRRAYVRGYRPKTDWVTDADPLIAGAMERAERRIGRNVQTVVLR